jgi:hypothetical protein
LVARVSKKEQSLLIDEFVRLFFADLSNWVKNQSS